MASRTGLFPRKENERLEIPPEVRHPGRLALIQAIARDEIDGVIIVLFLGLFR